MMKERNAHFHSVRIAKGRKLTPTEMDEEAETFRQWWELVKDDPIYKEAYDQWRSGKTRSRKKLRKTIQMQLGSRHDYLYDLTGRVPGTLAGIWVASGPDVLPNIPAWPTGLILFHLGSKSKPNSYEMKHSVTRLRNRDPLSVLGFFHVL